MVLSPDLLEMLACPQCGKSLRYTKEDLLVCLKCRLYYNVDEDVPLLTKEAAQNIDLNIPKTPIKRSEVEFEIIEGDDRGELFRLEEGTCRMLGRQIEEMATTMIIDLDGRMALDESTRKIVSHFVKKSDFTRHKQDEDSDNDNELGGFRRLPDVIFSDSGVSRLHAMLYHDQSGIGLVDLVSKNGTYVNGAEIEHAKLRVNDIIEIGRSQLKVKKVMK